MQECLTFTAADRDTELKPDLRLIKDVFGLFQTNIAMPKLFYVAISQTNFTQIEKKKDGT